MTDVLVAGPDSSTGARAPGRTGLRPFLPALVLLFVASGCAALIYEIVWLQLLGLVIGASAISLGVLLATFMGGMCIGSLLFPRLIPQRMHPLLVYGLLEFAIGMIALIEPGLINWATDFYTHLASPGAGAIALRAVIAGICLLPPTILMGATLPAIARYVEATPQGVSWMGFFYGGNIVGAVIGCLTAGFYLLRVYNMTTATRDAVWINVSIAVLAGILALMTRYESPAPEKPSDLPSHSEAGVAGAGRGGAWTIFIAIGLSGLTGLGAEVVWTRQLSLMLGATVYTFSNILAVFLLGLGIGSSVGALLARTVKRPRVALGWCQLLLAAGVAWAAYAISYSLPFWPLMPSLSTTPWYTFQVNLAECCWAVLPGALLWGASFPLALAAIAKPGQDPGKLVGSVYAANTVGAIVGSLLFSMVVMQFFGSQNAQRILIVICAISGMVAIAPLLLAMPAARGREQADDADRPTPVSMGVLAAGLAVAVVAAVGLAVTVGPPNWCAVAWGRNSAESMPYLYPPLLTADEYNSLRDASTFGFTDIHLENGKLVYSVLDAVSDEQKQKNKIWIGTHEANLVSAFRKREAITGGLFTNGKGNMLAYNDIDKPNRYCVYLGEGMNVSVAVTYDDLGYRYFHGAGKVQASTNPADMRLQRTLGHIAALTNWSQTKKTPEDVLVVACGAGVTAGSFVPYGSNITIVDIEPMVPHYVTPQFADANHHVIPPEISGDPLGYKKTHVIIDDGRHYIRTVKDKFDVITSDPIDPWVKGCAALNTVEYYQMCKDHLKPGGVMALWIPLYESSEETSKSVIATFFKVFPNGILWSNDQAGQGYDAVLFGSVPADPNAADTTLHLNIDDIQNYIDDPQHEAIRNSLRDVKFGTGNYQSLTGTCEAVELLSTYAGTAPRMGQWLANTDNLVNTDANLRLQYIAGLWINNQDEVKIFNSILKDYSFPDEIFTGSPDHMAALKQILGLTGRNQKGP